MKLPDQPGDQFILIGTSLTKEFSIRASFKSRNDRTEWLEKNSADGWIYSFKRCRTIPGPKLNKALKQIKELEAQLAKTIDQRNDWKETCRDSDIDLTEAKKKIKQLETKCEAFSEKLLDANDNAINQCGDKVELRESVKNILEWCKTMIDGTNGIAKQAYKDCANKLSSLKLQSPVEMCPSIFYPYFKDRSYVACEGDLNHEEKHFHKGCYTHGNEWEWE
jgi:archaellum component FlaC